MSFRRLTAAALAACTLCVTTPAWAHETHPAQEVDLGIELLPETPTYRIGQSTELKSPWLAAGMSLVGPAAMGLAAYSASTMPSPSNIYVNGMRTSQFAGFWLAAASPMGLGFGHAYAGDPWRGLLVGLGGPATVAGAGMVGFAIDSMVNPSNSWRGFTGLILGIAAGAIGYNVWAASDAYHTAERRNEAALRP